MIEKWKECPVRNGVYEALLTFYVYHILFWWQNFMYMDLTKLYTILKSNEIKHAAESLSLCFQNNSIKMDSERFHLWQSNHRFEMTYLLSSTYSENLLEIKTDHKLTFEELVEELCKKSQPKSQFIGKNSIFNEIWQKKAHR